MSTLAGHLATDGKILDLLDYASDTSDKTAEVDTKGYGGCCFVVKFAAVGGAGTIKAQEHDVTATGQADLAGTSMTVATDDDNQTFVLDIKRPLKRFLTLAIAKGSATTALMAWAILYNGDGPYPYDSTDVDDITVETHTSPIAGTA